MEINAFVNSLLRKNPIYFPPSSECWRYANAAGMYTDFYPNAASGTIISAKPAAAPTVPMLLLRSSAGASENGSSITTWSIAPAAVKMRSAY